MLKRCKLWLADWRDPAGKRIRKGFPTKKGAQRHQDKMRRATQQKKAPRSAASPRSAKRGNRLSPPRGKVIAAA